MQIIIQVFNKLGIPVAPDKVEGPTTCIVYLGICIDSLKMEICLPEDKLQDLLSELDFLVNRKKCTKKELQSLIGKLSFASKVVPCSRLFICRLIDLCKSIKRQHHHISLNQEARQDILWWLEFLPKWNGMSFILQWEWTLANDLNLFTDASGTIVFGIYHQGEWLAEPWPDHIIQSVYSIQWKELFPIFVVATIWGHQWSTKKILFHSDNQTVVDIWQNGSVKCPYLAHLLRQIFFLCAKYSFSINIVHIPGKYNILSDLLSRLQIAKFKALAKDTKPNPTPLPTCIWNRFC